MNNRRWLWLLLTVSVWLTASGSTTAQTFRFAPNRSRVIIISDSPGKQSYHPLPELPGSPEELMAERLRQLKELHEVQDQVQGLLKDPQFLQTLQQRFAEKDLRRLRDRLLRGDNLKGDPAWNGLLDQAVSGSKLKDRQVEILKRWAERSAANQKITDNRPPPVVSGPQPSPPSTTPPSASSSSSEPGTQETPQSQQRSFWDQMKGDSADWIKDNMPEALKEPMGDLVAEMIGALDELGVSDEDGPLADALRSLRPADASGRGWQVPYAKQAGGWLAHNVPGLGEFLLNQRSAWADVRGLFHDTDLPPLPEFNGPRMSALSTPSAPPVDDWGGGALALLLAGVGALLLWRLASWSYLRAGRAADAWRLGPWPVSPSAVGTRDELVKAFEYLALLRLGPAAVACHHRALAARLAEQGRVDPARERHAVELLADIYEQARYAPGDEPLSPDELAEARQALCLLAGVTAA